MSGKPKGSPKTGGRRKGTPNRDNLSARLRVVQEADPIGRLIEAATKGCVRIGEQEIALDVDQYLGVLRELRRVAVADAKSTAVRLDLPVIRTAPDVLQAAGKVISEMAKGNLAPDEAVTIASLLEAKRRAIETVELEARLAALEQAQRAK